MKHSISTQQKQEIAESNQRLQEKQPFNLSNTLFVDDSINILDSAKKFGIEHLLAVANPDSKQASRIINNYPSVTDFRTLIADITATPIN